MILYDDDEYDDSVDDLTILGMILQYSVRC